MVVTGPAHAVYFGTYELVKEAAGGNAEDGKHHPGAAGKSKCLGSRKCLVLTSS